MRHQPKISKINSTSDKSNIPGNQLNNRIQQTPKQPSETRKHQFMYILANVIVKVISWSSQAELKSEPTPDLTVAQNSK